MPNNKWSAGLAVLLAATATGICYWQMQRSNTAKEERDAEQRAKAEASTQLRDWERHSAGTKVDLPERLSNSVPVAATHEDAKAEADAKAALQTRRKAAIADALLGQRVRRLMSLEMNIRPKFHALGLSDEQWERYEMLSLEKMLREDEVRRAGRGDKTQEEFQAALLSVGWETVDEIKALIGAGPHEELERFQAERSDPVRSSVSFLSERLLFSNTPLETWQAEKLTPILRPPSSPAASQGDAHEGPEDKTAEVQSVLSPAQFWAWRQLQSQTRLIANANAIAQRFEAAKKVPPR